MIRNYLREEKVIKKKDACSFFKRAWEKLTPNSNHSKNDK